MKIRIAKTAGFCMGVRRAVDLVLDTANQAEGSIFTYGPLIHNPQVLDLLEEKGIHTLKAIPASGKGCVLVRAHGVPPESKEGLEQAGYSVIDATCPRVIKVQTIIRKHAKKGYASIIVGDKDHPEVIGLLGYADKKGTVVENMEDVQNLPEFENAIVVAQTTQNTAFFNRVRAFLGEKYPHYKIFNTICDSTEKRQAEIKKIAAEADVVIVVGGKSSGNTQRLAEIAKETGKPAYHVENEDELDMNVFSPEQTIAITAGASTPNWVINRVYRKLESNFITGNKGFIKDFFSIQRFLLLTNLYLAIGAGCLCYTSTKLQGISQGPHHIILAILYILSMHIFNNLTGIKEDRYNDPDRARFYEKNMLALSLLGLFSGGACLLTAYGLNSISFITLLVMSILGLSYNFTLVPKFLYTGKYRKIRNIPGAKTILISIAWGIVTTILPALSITGSIHFSTLIAFLLSTGIVFSRTALYNIIDMQGDRIAGKETIPLVIGEEKTKILIKKVLVSVSVLMLFASFLNLVTDLGTLLFFYPLYLCALIYIHEKDYILPGFKLEFLVESNFILAGVMTMMWAIWG